MTPALDVALPEVPPPDEPRLPVLKMKSTVWSASAAPVPSSSENVTVSLPLCARAAAGWAMSTVLASTSTIYAAELSFT